MESGKSKEFWKTEPFLGGLALLLLLAGCFLVLRPFVTALVWAMILAYSLHPLQRVFTRWFRGSRTLAACLVSLTVMIVFAGPVVLIGVTLAQDGKDLATATRDWFMAVPNEPPAWVGQVPVVGAGLEEYWVEFAEGRSRWMEQLDKEVVRPSLGAKDHLASGGGVGVEGALGVAARTTRENEAIEERRADSSHFVALLGRFLAWARSGLVAAGKALVQGVAQVLVSAFLAFFLLRDAPELSARLVVAVERLAGERGRHLLQLAGDTVRGVIFGILGTALVQALVAVVGFWIAGVPGAVLLAVLTFFFAVIPMGPPLIWLPASLWLFAQDKPGLGIFLLLWGGLGISSVDNFLRPYLISQGNKMPFALIFCGVIGGALAFGLVGVFIGPTLLAVTFRLVEEWSSDRPGPTAQRKPDDISPLLPGSGSVKSPHGGEPLGIG